jgi:uncharacterized protein YndB with AHSA1/START domain
MIDLVDQLNSVHRETSHRTIGAGEGRTVVLRRTYDAAIDDVWDAITTKERIERWFLPISGELKLGGRYQLEGNAGGDIVACEPPRLLRITWVYGEEPAERDVGEVEVRLTPAGEHTVLELEHAAVVASEFWDQFGPGAVGVGWDLTLLGLANHLAGEEFEDRENWESTPEAREFMKGSSEAWGDALRAAGTPEDVAAEMVRNTTAAYVPETEEA